MSFFVMSRPAPRRPATKSPNPQAANRRVAKAPPAEPKLYLFNKPFDVLTQFYQGLGIRSTRQIQRERQRQ